ncbi:hybrid sensor histidine kinase/response regulator transcription factor [uncultured Chitinophaga sp.]|uniref:hybrid sensor histidine kinase/response regulator transcription factor n=1 Tax=uncultured Chitinophaga sp. TaxID=339340 RepID=UPI0025CCBDFE|nr:hybrid sensor histidine kinase/response regulator transcription factor [uncultured Chitinophaga sp.]
MKYLISILLLLFGCGQLHAQTDPYQFSHVDIGQGLSNNQVNNIFRDSKGFMWFSTMSGLNRYDGYEFKVFRHDVRDSATISDDMVTRISEGPGGLLWITAGTRQNLYDPRTEKFTRSAGAELKRLNIPPAIIPFILKTRNGRYWLLHPNTGIYRHDPNTGKTLSVRHKAGDENSISTDTVAAITEDAMGQIWLVHHTGVLEKIDANSGKVLFRSTFAAAGTNQLYGMLADADGDLWLYCSSDARGIYYINPNTNSHAHYSQHDGKTKLNTNIVRGLAQDNKGLIWIGTDHGGVNVLDKKQQRITYLLSNTADPKSLSQNSITAMYRDNSGIIWIGTYKKGINYYHENIVKFPLYQYQSFNNRSLPYDDVNRFVEDAKGNIWIGTNGGGLIYFDRSTGGFTQYRNNPSDPNSISSNVIVSLLIDHRQQLWVGTYMGGLERFDNGKFKHCRNNGTDTTSLPNNNVWELFEDSRRQLWVGTLGGGLSLYDPAGDQFQTYRQPAIHSNFIYAIIEDKRGRLMVGTDDGIAVRDTVTGNFSKLTFTKGQLSNKNVICLFEDSRGWVWTGTREGLNLYDPATGGVRTFRKEDGLPENTVLNVLEDNDHTLWMSTTNGLCNVRVDAKGAFKFKNYDEADGLQGKEFNENAALKTRKGELVFGGANGFNLFFPHAIASGNYAPPLVFTGIEIFNQAMTAGDQLNGRVLIQQSITEMPAITLKHKENVFSVSFAALNYFHPERNRYAYMLEGFNKDWIPAGTSRKATYTNLDPGTYTFRVRAADSDGEWTGREQSLRIVVLPPFWRNPLAFGIYIILILSGLLLARRIILDRERMRFRITQERQEAQRMHELDALKIRFFTNISHEFRTPLSLILAPLEKIIKQTEEGNVKGHLTLMQRNARRLLNLVNQLLDFRKLEMQEIKLHATEGDMVAFVRELTQSFSDLSEKKHIQLHFESNADEIRMDYDSDKIEKIIFNLLSNAFKFTPDNGSITVSVQLLPDACQVSVKDTGIGIPPEQQQRIFERFFQHELPGSLLNQGSGIGLSITSEFVKLHGGTISVDSAPEMGSCFTVLFPLHASQQPPVREAQTEVIAKEASAKVTKPRTGKKPSLLLVEDNEDFRFYLKDNLGQYFHITEAANGKAAWDLLQQQPPDLIVSDVAMPGMDGLEFCRKVRGNHKTAHIPIVLLTARTADTEQIEALELGATDYITKPFNFEMLLSRLRNIISQHASLRETYRKKMEVQPSVPEVTPADEQLLAKAIAIVEQHMSNPDFSVEDLSKALFMSRVTAYKKLLALTGKTPIEFIRVIRLKRAASLLEKSQLTVAEVAYEVGFNNPKYFARYFKNEFNLLPSAYAAKFKE